VPDEKSRARVEQLLFEMDALGVAHALVVCAAIEGNRDNVEYVAHARERYPDRLSVLADVDCTWHETYHRPGAAARLEAAAARQELVGVTHCDEDGWDFPWRPAVGLFERVFRGFGAARLVWGSDYPVSRLFCTYRQSLEVVRRHCAFLGEADRAAILGGTLRELLRTRRPPG
jgi:predicted TIM-barrel fold metal-dependent hydrolase